MTVTVTGKTLPAPAIAKTAARQVGGALAGALRAAVIGLPCGHAARQNDRQAQAGRALKPFLRGIPANQLQTVRCFFPQNLKVRKSQRLACCEPETCRVKKESLTERRARLYSLLFASGYRFYRRQIGFLHVLRYRKSSVNGNSRLGCAGLTCILPGVWPICRKRVRRRLSAS